MNKIKQGFLRDFLVKTAIPISSISESSDVSRTSIHRFINGSSIKENTANKIIAALSDVFNQTINFNETISVESGEGDVPMNAEYILNLQKDKIELLQLKLKQSQNELNLLKSQPKKDSWLDIEYDVKTRQTYGKSFLYIEKYEFIQYSDFFKKLGYDDAEIEKEYKLHKANVLSKTKNKNDYGHIHHKWILDNNKKINTWNTMDKNGEEIPLNLWLDMSKSLGKTIVTYNGAITYIKKDGSHMNAHIYCCWDLVRMTGEAKIKFLNN